MGAKKPFKIVRGGVGRASESLGVRKSESPEDGKSESSEELLAWYTKPGRSGYRPGRKACRRMSG